MLKTFWDLEDLGRIPLSKSFYLRDFLHSEMAAFHRLPNVPVDMDLCVESGRRLCETVLEPLQDTFGRIHIRSGYRSPSLQPVRLREPPEVLVQRMDLRRPHLGCARREGNAGACACIVIPWFQQRHAASGWRKLAWWLLDHVDYHRIVFFTHQTSFNIGWRDNPKREIYAYPQPGGVLTGPGKPPPPADRAALYSDFPPLHGILSPLSA